MEGVRGSSWVISSVLDESNVNSREIQITSSPNGDSGRCVFALMGVEGAKGVDVDVDPS